MIGSASVASISLSTFSISSLVRNFCLIESPSATNLLQFLNLAELGVGAAIGYSLYKPLAEKNRQSKIRVKKTHSDS